MSVFQLAQSAAFATARFGLASGSMRVLAATPRLATSTRFAIYRHMSTQNRDVRKAIDDAVKSNPLVVFMKGVPEAPQCGFSNAVVQILDMHGVNKYAAFNVLEDQELRQEIKEYSNWPTVPQVYVNGEFIGGCDIMISLHKSGELVDILKGAGINSTMKYEADDEEKQ